MLRYGYTSSGHDVRVEFEHNSLKWRRLTTGVFDKSDGSFLVESEVWSNGMRMISSNDPSNALMSRGLYCLGFENPAIMSQLSPLSAHEKLELRLSMPREFWPPQWWAEEMRHAQSDGQL